MLWLFLLLHFHSRIERFVDKVNPDTQPPAPTYYNENETRPDLADPVAPRRRP